MDRTYARRRSDGLAAVAGLVVVGVGMVVVRDGAVPDVEERAFRALNDLPDALHPLLWPFQQLGVLVVGPLVAVVALLTRRPRLAGAAILATAAKLWLERVVKAVVSRDRPGTSLGDVHARGDVPLRGESFVSGHGVLVAALACLVAPYLSGRARAIPWVVVVLVLVGRVYVGAHNPLDVICGAGLGIAIGSALNLLVGVPAARSSPPSVGRRVTGR